MNEALENLQSDMVILIDILGSLDMSAPDVDDLLVALSLSTSMQDYIDSL